MDPKVMDAVGFISRFVNDHWESMADSSEVSDQLSHHGFSSREISDAFRWIEANTLGDKDANHGQSGQQMPIRVLTAAEKSKLSSSAQGLLMVYQGRGLVDAMILEDILERVQRSEEEEVSDKEIRRISALAIFTRVQDDWKELLQTTNTLIH